MKKRERENKCWVFDCFWMALNWCHLFVHTNQIRVCVERWMDREMLNSISISWKDLFWVCFINWNCQKHSTVLFSQHFAILLRYTFYFLMFCISICMITLSKIFGMFAVDVVVVVVVAATHFDGFNFKPITLHISRINRFRYHLTWHLFIWSACKSILESFRVWFCWWYW